MNPLKKTIGIIGGGQLGRMIIEESMRLNLNFNILDAADCSCSNLAINHIIGKLTDGDKIKELAQISDALTYEIEHIDVDTLCELEKQGKTIIPSPGVLKIIQDKGIQKEFFYANNIPTSGFKLVNNSAEWVEAIRFFGTEKLVAKTRKDGYDGKGVTIFNAAEVLANTHLIPFNSPSLIEEFIECETELSVMVTRDKSGNMLTWPVVQMDFDPVANLVTFLDCPAQVSVAIAEKAKEIALQTINCLNSPGVFAVEMFLTKNQNILVNEVAPRPHNSGHHTIEACYTSQFEQLARILIDLPLGSTELIQPAVMMNLLGAEDFSGSYRLQGIEEASAIQGVYIHLYNKASSKPMRKMGHITVVANTLYEAKNKAQQVSKIIKLAND